jgi:tripartite ATP-independent transporter DctM subunit
MFVKISMDTIETTAVVLFIVASASIFAWVLTTTQVTEAIGNWVLSISDNPYVFLLLANVFLLFVGCFMETIAAITILVPVFMPIIAKLGIDPVHFGLVMILNLMIGLMTPPVGMVLFILQKVARLSFEATVKAVLPWLWPLLATLALITYIPQLVLWLPGIMYPK